MAVLAGIGDAFARVSPRERKLLAGLALIALILAPLKAFEMRQTALEDNRLVQEQVAAAKAAARRATGQGLGAQIERTQDEIRDWSWSAPSVAVGQVMAQNELAEMAAAGGLAAAQVSAVGKPVAAGAVTLVGIEIEAPFNWSGLSGFLGELSQSGKGFILEEVAMTEDKTPKLEILVRVPVSLAETGPA